MRSPSLQALEARIVSCRLCPRLVAWREEVARTRRRAYLDQVYWGRPIPGFGDPDARIVLVGLAPGAHGSNRPGRMFTGDRSGDFLYGALHRARLANQPESLDRADGLTLSGVLITAAVRCAPPGNRPLPEESARCRAFLAGDLAGLDRLRVVLALGRIAHDAVLGLLRGSGEPASRRAASPAAGAARREGKRTPDPGPRTPVFSHGAVHAVPGGIWLVDSYHVSQRNTQTGLLTPEMFDAILERCRVLREAPGRSVGDRPARGVRASRARR